MGPGEAFVPSLREYSALWGITPSACARAGGAPSGPDESWGGDRPAGRRPAAALVTNQVRSGLVVRMAVLYDLLTTGPVAVARRRAVEVA